MKKTTIIAVVAVAILAGVFLLVSIRPQQEEMKSLSLPGIRMEEKKPAAAEEEKEEVSAKDSAKETAKVGPPDKIVVARQGKEMVLVREEEDLWKMTSPIESGVESYKVRSMLRVFNEPLHSNYSRQITQEALSKVGLDEANRIRVTFFKGEEKLVDLYIGRVDKGEEFGSEPDTLVMVPEADMTYYRIPNKDLRAPFDVEVDEIRDKKIFSFKKDDVTKLVISDPREKNYNRIVLARKESKEDKEGEGGETSGSKEEWELVEPAGFEVENISGYVSSLANVRAEEFMDKLPGADAAALDKAYRIDATVKSGDKEEVHSLLLGAGRGKGVYGQVEGRDGYVLIGKWNAKQLMKGLNDFRKKKVFSFEAKDIEEISLAASGAPLISLRKGAKKWEFVEPAGEFASDSKVKSLASSIANFRVAEFLSTSPAVSETGLDNPDLTVSVTLSQSAGGGTAGLLIGKKFKNEKDQDRYYAQVKGQAEVFAIMEYSRNNVAKTVDDLRDKRVFRIERDDIASVTIKHPDEELKFVREEKEGKTAWNMTAPKEIKDVSIHSILTTMASLDVEKVVEDKKPEEVGLDKETFTVSVTLKDGSTHAITFSEEVEDNNNYASTSTEPELAGKILQISKYKVQNLAKKLPDFEK